MPVNLDRNGFLNGLNINLRLTIWKLNTPLDVPKVSILRIISAKRVPSIRDSIFHWFQGWCRFLRFTWRNEFSLQPVFSFDVSWLCPPPFSPGKCPISVASPHPIPQCPHPIHLTSTFFSFYDSHWFLYGGEIVQKKFPPKLSPGILYQEELPNIQFYYMPEQVPRSNCKRPIIWVI